MYSLELLWFALCFNIQQLFAQTRALKTHVCDFGETCEVQQTSGFTLYNQGNLSTSACQDLCPELRTFEGKPL